MASGTCICTRWLSGPKLQLVDQVGRYQPPRQAHPGLVLRQHHLIGAHLQQDGLLALGEGLTDHMLHPQLFEQRRHQDVALKSAPIATTAVSNVWMPTSAQRRLVGGVKRHGLAQVIGRAPLHQLAVLVHGQHRMAHLS